MDKSHMTDAVDHMTAAVSTHRHHEASGRLTRWYVLLAALALPLGGLSDLRRRRALVSFVAEPADDSCRCDGGRIRSHLTDVRIAHMAGLRLVDRRVGRSTLSVLTGVWVELAEEILEMVPTELHTGLVVDFGQGIIGCWHDWTCLECFGPAPCLVVDLTASALPDYRAHPAVGAVPVLVTDAAEGTGGDLDPPGGGPGAGRGSDGGPSGEAGPPTAKVHADDGGSGWIGTEGSGWIGTEGSGWIGTDPGLDPPAGPGFAVPPRSSAELVDLLLRRMGELAVCLPCRAMEECGRGRRTG